MYIYGISTVLTKFQAPFFERKIKFSIYVLVCMGLSTKFTAHTADPGGRLQGKEFGTHLLIGKFVIFMCKID